MTREEFIKTLEVNGYKWKEEGEWIIVSEESYIYLNYLESIPDNVRFDNRGYVNLPLLKSIPDNIQFMNEGRVFLSSLKSMGDNVKFRNGGRVFLNSLKSIPINLDAEEIFQNRNDIKIDGKWLELEKNISFPYSRWKSVDGRVKMYESWIKNNF